MLKWMLRTLVVLLLLAVGARAVLVALEVRAQLDPRRAPVEAAAEAGPGREISFDGDVVLVPTLWPTLEVADASVANPPQWPEGVFASAGTVRLQLGAAPLPSGEIRIADITAKDVAIIAWTRVASDKEGVMNDRVIFADTTKMRIEGSAKVDFRQRTLDVEAGPIAKKPEFFSLAVPVGLSGKFDDFGIDINPVVLTGKTVSFLTSPVHVPQRRICVKGEPADGKAACAEVWTVRDDAGPTTGGREPAAQEAEPDDAEAMEPKSNGEEPDSKDDSSSAFGRLEDKIEDAVDESPDAEPAIDVLNLNE
jgi:hypothetical protein